jgi:hypothetical protein
MNIIWESFPRKKEIYNANSGTITKVTNFLLDGKKLFNRALTITKTISKYSEKIEEYRPFISSGIKILKLFMDYYINHH